MIEAFLISMAISLALNGLSALLAPKPKAPSVTKYGLGDFDAPTAQDGKPVPVVFGTRWITGPNVLWYGDLKTVAIKKKGGGKK